MYTSQTVHLYVISKSLTRPGKPQFYEKYIKPNYVFPAEHCNLQIRIVANDNVHNPGQYCVLTISFKRLTTLASTTDTNYLLLGVYHHY